MLKKYGTTTKSAHTKSSIPRPGTQAAESEFAYGRTGYRSARNKIEFDADAARAPRGIPSQPEPSGFTPVVDPAFPVYTASERAYAFDFAAEPVHYVATLDCAGTHHRNANRPRRRPGYRSSAAVRRSTARLPRYPQQRAAIVGGTNDPETDTPASPGRIDYTGSGKKSGTGPGDCHTPLRAQLICRPTKHNSKAPRW